MLESMRQIALDFLFSKVGGKGLCEDLESWYESFAREHPEELFPFLVEPSEKITEVVIMAPDSADSALNNLTTREITGEIGKMLPFMRPSGSQSSQIGPVIKRSFTNRRAGPSAKILQTTLKTFEEVAVAEKPWSSYFKEIVAILQRPNLKLPDQSVCSWKLDGYSSALEAAVERIGEKRQTVFLAIADAQSKLPGERLEYLDYLMTEKLGGDRYVTGAAPAKENCRCPLCGKNSITVFPNAVKGAGINFGNVDREGAFPGISTANAWKAFALCRSCADLLYIYKFHVLNPDPVSQKRPFTSYIAGDKALIIPFSTVSVEARMEMHGAIHDYVKHSATDVEEDELTVLDILKDQKAVLNINILWADVGQNLEDLRGSISDVPPSRLSELSTSNEKARQWQHPIFPENSLAEFKPNLGLSALKHLFRRPGGKKVQKENESRRLFQLRREIAASIYNGKPLPMARIHTEMMTTARRYLDEIASSGDPYGLLNEGLGKKGPFLTACGWIKYTAWWLFYFKRIGVFDMPEVHFQPQLESLKPYFGPESGIDSAEKAFAFLLGVLYGKLLQIQAARGVNVGSNALTWLKRLTLMGKDLPELYVKTREKLLAYESEGSREIRALIEEIGVLGIRLGSNIHLDETGTCYFLLLGQSLTKKILPSKKDNDPNLTEEKKS